MKSLAKSLIVCVLAVVFSASAKPSKKDWKLDFEESGVSVWRLKSNNEVKGVYHQDPSTPGVNWNQFTSKEVFKKWEEPKKKIMKAIGITDWKADKYKWEKEGKRHRLEISGSYVNRKKKKVYFHEVHYYTAEETLKLLITSPERRVLSQSAVQRGFIRNVRRDFIKGGA